MNIDERAPAPTATEAITAAGFGDRSPTGAIHQAQSTRGGGIHPGDTTAAYHWSMLGDVWMTANTTNGIFFHQREGGG